MPVTSRRELFTGSNNVSRSVGQIQPGGGSNAQPPAFKVLTEPRRNSKICMNFSDEVVVVGTRRMSVVRKD